MIPSTVLVLAIHLRPVAGPRGAMQQLKWWAHCLVLRTVPQSFLTRESPIRPQEVGMEELPLRPSLPHHPSTPPLSCKAYSNGIFVVLGALMLGVLVTLVNSLVATWPGVASEHHWQRAFVEILSNTSIRDHLRHLTKEPHVAGTPEDFASAHYVLSTFEAYGLPAHYTDYDVLLSFPLHRSLVLSSPNVEPIQLSLQEKPVAVESYSSNPRVVPAFHGYAPSGNVSAEVVYANYGSEDDFRTLAALEIDVKGAIVIARYAQVYRGAIVENAAKAGAVAVIVYSDPQDYGANQTQGFYPDSRWLPPSGTQRGSVFRGVGDPLTPGWPSTTIAERLAVSNPHTMLPTIPSLPISAEDALPILASLDGPVAPSGWHGALDLPAYKLGRGPGVLNLSYLANLTVMPIRNVFAVIKGAEEPDRYVLLGNHRDAWTFGAVDPSSGTAALLELARGLGKLVRKGWKPRRSIILCSWDAEEYGLVGSTEWVEQNVDILGASAVAYLNVDCAVAGPDFFVASSPQLDGLLQDITKEVKDPDSEGRTVYDTWVASSKGSTPAIDRLGGGGSDFAAFLQHAGVPAMDLYFGDDYPVYHSLYDNFYWMEKFGDPLFQRHLAVTSLWGLIAMRLANDAMLPLDHLAYATELQMYAKATEKELIAAKAPEYVSTSPLFQLSQNSDGLPFTCGMSCSGIAILLKGFAQLYGYVKATRGKVRLVQALSEVQQASMPYMLQRQRELNNRLLMVEHAFLDSEGLNGKPWYKHLIFGPVTNKHYGSSSFPGILNSMTKITAESIDDAGQQWEAVQHEIWRVSRVIVRAARGLTWLPDIASDDLFLPAQSPS